MRFWTAVRVASVVVGVSVCAALADWPQFQGPDRSGISPEKVKLARSWPAGGPKELWAFDLGVGFGGPAIHEGKVYLLDRVGKGPAGKDVLRCIDLAGGKEAWSAEYEAPDTSKVDHYGSRSTPAVDDKYVFAVGTFGGFYCVERAGGKKVWEKNIVADFAGKVPTWGVAQSPVLYKDMVIVAPLSDKGVARGRGGKKAEPAPEPTPDELTKFAGVAAFRKDTGELIWKSEPIGSMQYASPYVTNLHGVEQIVIYGNRGNTNIVGVNAADGGILWSFGGWKCSIPIASPVSLGDGRFFMSGGYGAGSVMFKVERQGGTWTAKELWKISARECGSQIQDPLLWQGHFYVDNNENGKQQGMTCIDLDGKVKWQANSPKLDRGGQIIAGGLLVKVDGFGTLHLIDPSPEGLKVLASAKVLEGRGGEVWAPIAITDGKLIVRDQNRMKCLDLK